MSRPLSNSAGSSPAPNDKGSLSADTLVERVQAWYQVISDQAFSYLHRTMWNRAYLALGSADEADVLMDKVVDEVMNYPCPPSIDMIEKLFHRLTTWRIRDRLKSPKYRLRMELIPLTWRSRDGEEFEVDLGSGAHPGADEEFFHWEENEETAKALANAILRLSGRQRLCFFLVYMEKMKPKEIQEVYDIASSTVSTESYRALQKVRKWLHEWQRQRKGKT